VQIVSFIKEAFKRSDEYGSLFLNKWYQGNLQKPFTFSLYFPIQKRNRKAYLVGDYIRLFFSTNDFEFIYRFYNGAIKLKGKYKIFGDYLKIKSMYLLPEREFPNGLGVFKTISPLLLRDRKDTDMYLYPVDGPVKYENIQGKAKYWKGVELEDFKRTLEERLSNMVNEDVRIPEILIKGVIPVPICSTRHNFKVTYPGIKCYLKIKGSPFALKVFYDIGIGARRSEGFGMLEVEGG